MKQFFLPLLLMACLFSVGQAQNGALLPDREFNENLTRGDSFLVKQPGVALEYYKRALKVAQTDVQKASAHLGIGKSTPFHGKGEADPKNENEARRIAFETVLNLPEASAAQKHEARLALGLMQLNVEQYETALASFETISKDLTGTQPAQRGDALLYAGEALLGLKRYDEARTRLNNFLSTDTTDPKEAAVVTAARKTVARQLIARSHLAQNNPRMALFELNKRVTSETKDAEAEQIYLGNGDFFLAENQPVLARACYEMVPTLSEGSSEGNLKALMQTGVSYYEQKNYAKAREIWNALPTMRGATDKLKSDVWHSIGVAYTQEKNYSAARESFATWRESNPDIGHKVQAWETIASTFLAEKNYDGARDALTNVGKLGNTLPADAKSQLNLRQKIGTAQIYREEANFAQAATVYKEILALTPISNTQPLYYYEAQKQVKAAADEMAKTPASMDAAFALYEAWEKHYPYEFNKGEANMAMGDILVAQGKKDEAKAKYQRVIELRKTYDDAKIAQQKIDKLEGKAN